MANKAYLPTLNSRKPEQIIWFFTILLLSLSFVLNTEDSLIAYLRIGGWAFFLLAIVLSYGNWMDRNTKLAIEKLTLDYSNGLRIISLKWDDISEIYVYFGKYANRVFVMSDKQRITFSIQREKQASKRVGMGFSNGKEILKKIISLANIPLNSKTIKKNYYYYSKN